MNKYKVGDRVLLKPLDLLLKEFDCIEYDDTLLIQCISNCGEEGDYGGFPVCLYEKFPKDRILLIEAIDSDGDYRFGQYDNDGWCCYVVDDMIEGKILDDEEIERMNFLD